MKRSNLVSVILPAYNEEGNIKLVSSLVTKILKGMNYEIIFIDDGSRDRTLEIVKSLAQKNRRIKYLSFSRNFGQQAALKAGLDYAKGDCVISMDADLQHPPELLEELINWWKKGYEVVYTLRDDKKTPLFKKITASLFYKITNWLSEVKIESGSADFRLMDRKVVDAIKEMEDAGVFLRGLVGWCGFKQKAIKYIPNKRHAGVTGYSVKKMFNLAVNGILSFSIEPLLWPTTIGLAMMVSAVGYLGYLGLWRIIGRNLENEVNWLGWGLWFGGGLQFWFLGIIGHYLGKIFMAGKRRPSYIVAKSNLK